MNDVCYRVSQQFFDELEKVYYVSYLEMVQ